MLDKSNCRFALTAGWQVSSNQVREFVALDCAATPVLYLNLNLLHFIISLSDCQGECSCMLRVQILNAFSPMRADNHQENAPYPVN